LFQVHIEGGKLNQKGLQIDITGDNGNLQLSNERAFVTQHDDVIKGAQGEGDHWHEFDIPDEFRTIPQSDLNVSVQDLAQLYAAFARDRATGAKSTRDFADAVSVHRLIDAIVDASSSNQTVILKEHALAPLSPRTISLSF
jgi:predicted dehydrogenase